MMNKTVFSFLLKTTLLLSIVGIFFFSFSATAQNSAFTRAYNTLYTTFSNARAIVYVVSGFGLVGFAVAAIMGKFDWMWLSMIAVALFTLAAAELVVKTAVEYGGGQYQAPAGQTMEAQLGSLESALGYDASDAQKITEALQENSL
ncbi:MAG: hypothetical protein J6T55_01540 [Alphaproteobacteria bacterium]|nr:hypothetical protein [Alphaproteobacteria bacterium]